MATGDIVSVTIGSDGWYADIVIAGLSTGGTYNFGLGRNNDPFTGLPTIIFSVVSMGFDDGGNAITVTRPVYGTHAVRRPYPNAASMQESTGGGNLTVRVSLSDFIFAKDASGAGNSGTAPTVTILSGFYTQGGTPNNASGAAFAVTNNSTLAYPRVLGNHSRPYNDKVGATLRVGGVFFHAFAQQGRQVRAVKLIASDAHSNSVSAIVNKPAIDWSYGDATPVEEWFADLNTSGLTQGDLGKVDFQAFPWIGDAGAVLDTAGTLSGSVAGTSGDTPLYGTRNFLCDPNGTYSQAIACVDSTGSDSTGAVATSLTSAATTPFLTSGKALAAIAAWNNSNASHNDTGGGNLVLGISATSQNFTWLGSTPSSYGNVSQKCNLIVSAYPGSTATINAFGTARWTSPGASQKLMIKVVGVIITATNGTGLFDPNSSSVQGTVHLDQCELNVTTTSPTIYRNACQHITRCKMTNWVQGVAPFSTVNSPPAICRGNYGAWGSLPSNSVFCYTFIGNKKTSSSSIFLFDTITGSACPAMTNQIIAHNFITTTYGSVALMGLRFAVAETHGLAVVGNVFECTNSGSPALLQIGADDASSTCNSVVIHANVGAGQRLNFAYNDEGSPARQRLNWSIKNNVFDNGCIKSDNFNGHSVTATRTFSAGTVTCTVTPTNQMFAVNDTCYIPSATPAAYATGSTGATVTAVSGTGVGATFTYQFAAGSDPGAITAMTCGPHPGRVGNWSVLYGCGCSGNFNNETTGMGASGSFPQELNGLCSILPAQTPDTNTTSITCATNAATLPGFANRGSFNGSTNGAGGGIYQLLRGSVGERMCKDQVLSFDITGMPRSLGNRHNPGPYAAIPIRQNRRMARR